jgi:Uma2 family endonuclease
MALPAETMTFSRTDFLAWEEAQSEKYEFWQGEVFAMTSARQSHVIVSLNIAAQLKQHLRGTLCRVYIADMAVEVEQSDAILYPDVAVSCHPEDLAAERTLRHPKVVIEVLSDSTAAYDRGKKFAAYRSLPDLAEYVLVDPDARRLEIYRRTADGDWLLALNDSNRALVLNALELELPLTVVFEDIGASG